jgi:hypothetical protein
MLTGKFPDSFGVRRVAQGQRQPVRGNNVHGGDRQPAAAGPSSQDFTQARMADAQIRRGKGGETHQTADGGMPTLTTQRSRLARGRASRRRSRAFPAASGFRADSPLEGGGFEPSVPPVTELVSPAGTRMRTRRQGRSHRSRLCSGTKGSNPLSSSGESATNHVPALASTVEHGALRPYSNPKLR